MPQQPAPGRLPRDSERVERIRNTLDEANLDALVCALNSNVLMLSGYWPVIGSSLAVFTRGGAVGLLAPQDEAGFAAESWADIIHIFEPVSLQKITTVIDTVKLPLSKLGGSVGLRRAKIGYEGASFDPSTYASNYVYGAAVPTLLAAIFPEAKLVDATEQLAGLRAVLTSRELEHVRNACSTARDAFLRVSPAIQPGMREFEIASLLRSQLQDPRSPRSDGYAYCMSGPNSSMAYAAFQQSGSRAIERGDTVLLHCNSVSSGFWTDITRTFTVHSPSAEQDAITAAVLEASRNAISVVKPGVPASLVDAAARNTLRRCGFGREFKHPAGHGVGFAAISHAARPLIHPLSEETLEPGMVFNIEPAVYLEGQLGIRHCDMMAVTENGGELLTLFQDQPDQLRLATRSLYSGAGGA
jgi:Xaa-Pro aminopeptidase